MQHPPSASFRIAIIDVCRYRNWNLLVALVRPDHIHIFVLSAAPLEIVMLDFQAYASRMLNRECV